MEMLRGKKNIENRDRKRNKVGHEYPGEGAAKTTVAEIAKGLPYIEK
jgi:hypothetical protein